MTQLAPRFRVMFAWAWPCMMMMASYVAEARWEEGFHRAREYRGRAIWIWAFTSSTTSSCWGATEPISAADCGLVGLAGRRESLMGGRCEGRGSEWECAQQRAGSR